MGWSVIQGGMTHESLLNGDWGRIVGWLGGAQALERSARTHGAFKQARAIKNAVDMLRLVLAYCLGDHGLRLTTAWAASMGLADISAPALLYRLRECGDWLSWLIERTLDAAAPAASRGRLIRIIDGTSVAKAGRRAKRQSALWRIHSAFDLPAERFSFFELTDERDGETLDRIPVVAGEIRLADRAYLQPDRIAKVLAAGGDVVVRGKWKGARWRDENGHVVDLVGLLRKARSDAQREGYTLSKATLEAADWVIIVTSLSPKEFSTEDILALYRLRWRIELAFKRLKSVIGLKGPPGYDARSARSYILAHLLMILLLEPSVDELEDSPPALAAA